MLNKLKNLYESNLEMILSSGAPWSRYIIYRDILKYQQEKRLSAIKRKLIEDSKIQAVYQKLFDSHLGVPSITTQPASHKVYGSYYWGLRFLADIGLTATDFQFDEIVRQLFIHQLPEGLFTIAYRRKNKIPVTAVCVTANLVYSLAMLGYQHSRGVQAALKFILTTQRKDGGWHCDWKKQPGEKDEDALSCPSANISVIRALAVYGERYGLIIQRAIEQIFDNWNNRNANYRQCDFDVGTTLVKLRYPPHYWGCDILNVLDTLSFYPEFCENYIFDEMIQQVISRWKGKGLFKSEKSIPEWREFDFANKNSYSCWISCLICRILARVYFSAK